MTTPTTPTPATIPLEGEHWNELHSAFEQYMRQVLLAGGYFTAAGARRHATDLAGELLSITHQTLTGHRS
ncbi:hypothetical protein ACQHIV_35200 [Kribbella sp. GL6]|uniref:hypothetical protein n=1 Tax=Kribbella sp. GL6 TaxID=3419765 RepID=UPI003D044664